MVAEVRTKEPRSTDPKGVDGLSAETANVRAGEVISGTVTGQGGELSSVAEVLRSSRRWLSASVGLLRRMFHVKHRRLGRRA